MSLNVVALTGRMVADAELRSTQQGTVVCSFRIAVDRYAGKDKAVGFFDVVAWRNTAEFIVKYFHKGDMIALSGHLQTRSYEDKHGSKRTVVEIVAESVSFGGSKGETGNSTPRAEKRDARENSRLVSDVDAQDDFASISDDEDLPF